MLNFYIRIFFPLAFGYYLSYFYRTVNAIIAPDIISELAFTPAQIGWVSSAYFASFALFQIPLGILLDRIEIRKLCAFLLLFAAIGSLVFALNDSVAMLWFGRFLIGLGVSACLMGAFKAYVMWLPTERLPLMNGLQLGAGGIGALTATTPVELALQITDWRGVFLVLAAVTLVSSLLIICLVPKQKIAVPQNNVFEQLWEYFDILKSPIFYAVAPLSFLAQAAFISIQSLWAGQWLREAILLPREVAAQYLLISAAATVLGYVGMGSIASKLQKIGISSRTVSITGLNLFLGVQILIVLRVDIPTPVIWGLFGFIGTSGSLMYATLLQQFPKRLSGRVITSLNLLLFVSIFLLQWIMGLIVNLWPIAASGHSPLIAYQYAFSLAISLQVVGLIWYLSQRKKLLSLLNRPLSE
ncbi:MAG: MFS transporter [Oceanospirillaceae bacterium]